MKDWRLGNVLAAAAATALVCFLGWFIWTAIGAALAERGRSTASDVAPPFDVVIDPRYAGRKGHPCPSDPTLLCVTIYTGRGW